MSIVFLFLLGLVFGSFLNVLICRYDENHFILDPKIIGGRSRCPKCRKTLKWFELIPLFSFFLQKKKCRGCKETISFQYPIIEFVSGLIFVFVPVFIHKYALLFFLKPKIVPGSVLFGGFSENAFVVFWIFIVLSLIVLSAIDFKKMIIPNELNVFIGILGAGVSIIAFFSGRFNLFFGSFLGSYASLFGFRENIFLNRIAAVLAAAIFLGSIILVSRGRAIGGGDLKLAVALSLVFGWPDIILILMLSFVIGSIYSLFLIVKKGKKMNDRVPFGPFIAIAAITIFFFGSRLTEIYFNIFKG